MAELDRVPAGRRRGAVHRRLRVEELLEVRHTLEHLVELRMQLATRKLGLLGRRRWGKQEPGRLAGRREPRGSVEL